MLTLLEMVTVFVIGVFHPGTVVKARVCVPTVSPETVAPLLWELPPSTDQCAPAATA